MSFLLDTHVWIWLNAAPDRLSPRIAQLLSTGHEDRELLLSAISIVELVTLVEKGRLKLLTDLDEWVHLALDQPSLHVVPVTQAIALRTGQLEHFEHFDPADRLIVATAQVENATIITADRVIRAYKRVRTIW